jgi:hypothetical protein
VTAYSYVLIPVPTGEAKILTGVLATIEKSYVKGQNRLFAIESGIIQASAQEYDGAGWVQIASEPVT